MKHPDEEILALYAAADLPLWRQWATGWHVRRCERCRAEVSEFRRTREGLADEAAGWMPAVDWERLAAEMQANIRVGLAAGQCIRGREPERRRWPLVRVAAVAVPLIVLTLAGFWLQLNRLRTGAPSWKQDVLLEATGGGIELRLGDRVLILQHPEAERVTYSGSAQGSLRAHWVDAETGQVTIQNVYAP